MIFINLGLLGINGVLHWLQVCKYFNYSSYLLDIGILILRKKIGNAAQTNIAKINTHLKNNIPFGQTTIQYHNGSSLVLNLNQKGEFCGPQVYNHDEYTAIRHALLDPSSAWVKTRSSYNKYVSRDPIGGGAYLTQDLESAIYCKYFGYAYGKFCYEKKLAIVDGFLMRTTPNEKDLNEFLLFDYHLPSDSKKHEYTDKLCDSDQNLGTWLRNVENDPWISLDQNLVSLMKMLSFLRYVLI